METMIKILSALANVVIVLAVAPLLEGIMRKITARIQSRQGPPILQPYYDLMKLLIKEDIESGESPAMQRFSAIMAFASALTIVAFLPLGFGYGLSSHTDIILTIYLLTFCGVCTLIAGLAAGSTYSLVGISREMMLMIPLEPILAVALIIAATNSGSFKLDAVLNGSIYNSHGVFPISSVIILIIILASFQAYIQRVPFDISEAETEIMDGPLVEYSGPKLALFKYSRMIRLVIYCALFIGLFAPWGSNLIFPFGFLIFWFKVLLLVLLVTVIAATHARYRIDQAINYFAIMLLVSFFALALASIGI
ncbi:MAG TPA: NADH-quinone oxidoreductase subunit H [Verrucomicrobiota bacterium]|nr:NADH-quinone oxidoreductase subunit H [Verrucomicrobiota bacterium]